MAFFNFLRGQGIVRTPITPEEARERGDAMQYRREWQCACGTQLKIRAREPHFDGPSNFVPYPVGHNLAGHSQLQPRFLTWNGMAEERGWKTDPIQCPACQKGLSLKDYKEGRRKGLL